MIVVYKQLPIIIEKNHDRKSFIKINKKVHHDIFLNHHRWKAQRERYMNHFSSIMLYQKVESGEKSREKGWNSDKHLYMI